MLERVYLSEVSTSDLVNELRNRAGVEETIAEPDEKINISVDGPATVLVVID